MEQLCRSQLRAAMRALVDVTIVAVVAGVIAGGIGDCGGAKQGGASHSANIQTVARIAPSRTLFACSHYENQG